MSSCTDASVDVDWAYRAQKVYWAEWQYVDKAYRSKYSVWRGTQWIGTAHNSAQATINRSLVNQCSLVAFD